MLSFSKGDILVLELSRGRRAGAVSAGFELCENEALKAVDARRRRVDEPSSSAATTDPARKPTGGSDVKEGVPLALVQPPPAAASPADRELAPQTLARAQRGDASAQRALVAQYERRVFAFVGRMLVDGSRVEDVCQECFLRVFRALPKFDPNGPARLSTWIFTIAHRLCIDEQRRQRRSAPLEEDPIVQADADVIAMERALRRRVERAVASLSEDLRATFVLRVVAELSVEETARVLDVDEGTVKSRLSRARERIRAHIGEV
jgi:RNA polymerase sigma-70 factor (ECF subfamily)